MRKNANFKKSYLQTMTDLKGRENQRGQAISSLFRDYLEGAYEWKPGPIENYKDICKSVRNFVLPMNPPRFELESALKKFLSAKGITIKRTPFKSAEGETSSAKRRRRRRKPKSASADNANTEKN
jgi:poly(A) polymerase